MNYSFEEVSKFVEELVTIDCTGLSQIEFTKDQLYQIKVHTLPYISNKIFAAVKKNAAQIHQHNMFLLAKNMDEVEFNSIVSILKMQVTQL